MTTENVVFGAEQFIGLASEYASDKKVKRVVDALCSASDNREDVLASALEIIGRLEEMSDNGSGYTPDNSLGFGSDNAATIADTLLGRRASAGEVRKRFNKVGS
jgi:hypothetical protein